MARRITRGDIHARLRRSITPREPRLVRILARVRSDLRNVLTYQEIGQALQSGQLSQAALEQWRQDYSKFVQDKLKPEWDRQIEAAGKATAGDIAAYADAPMQFSPTGARVIEWVEQRAAERVVSWTQLQHEAAQSIIGNAMQEGVGSDELGRRLRAVTGLTPRQAEAVETMRAAIIADGVEPAKAAVQAQRYADMLHRQRALRIARTELASAYNQGQDAAIKQAISDGMFDGAVEKFWSTADDERVCDICGPMDGMRLGIGDEFEPGVEVPPIHPSCVLPGTLCVAPGGVVAGIRAWYDGYAIKLTFANGRTLAVTENHLLPTLDGFAAAKHLRKGDYILNCTDFERMLTADPDADNRPALIEDIVHARSEASGMMTRGVPVTAEYLHGDGHFVKGNIDVIAPDRLLSGKGEPACGKHLTDDDLSPGDVDTIALDGGGSFEAVLLGLARASDGIMGGRREALPFLRRSLSHTEVHSLAPVARLDSGLEEAVTNSASGKADLLLDGLLGHAGFIESNNLFNREVVATRSALDDSSNSHVLAEVGGTASADLLRDLVYRQAGLIEPLEIVDVEIQRYAGHVYDLQSFSTLYIANGVLSSNCRCVVGYQVQT